MIPNPLPSYLVGLPIKGIPLREKYGRPASGSASLDSVSGIRFTVEPADEGLDMDKVVGFLARLILKSLG